MLMNAKCLLMGVVLLTNPLMCCCVYSLAHTGIAVHTHELSTAGCLDGAAASRYGAAASLYGNSNSLEVLLVRLTIAGWQLSAAQTGSSFG